MTPLHPVLSIRLFQDEKCFGPGVAQLLHQVEVHHSLRGAAMAMGMAYSKAWTMMRRSEAQLGFPLLVYTTGGRHGGGAVLTEQALTLLAAYDRYCQRLTEQAQALFQEEFGGFL